MHATQSWFQLIPWVNLLKSEAFLRILKDSNPKILSSLIDVQTQPWGPPRVPLWKPILRIVKTMHHLCAVASFSIPNLFNSQYISKPSPMTCPPHVTYAGGTHIAYRQNPDFLNLHCIFKTFWDPTSCPSRVTGSSKNMQNVCNSTERSQFDEHPPIGWLVRTMFFC